MVSGVTFTIVGAFQVAAVVRRRWHRVSGRVLLPVGFAAGLSALWLTVGLPWVPGDGWPLFLLRLGFGGGMVVATVVGAHALVRRRYRDHGSWMLRAYALGAAAGTQAIIQLPIVAIAGAPTGNLRAVLMGAGWVINLAVAEWVIRRRPRPGAAAAACTARTP